MEDLGLEFNEDGNCTMLVGDDFPVNVRRDEARGCLVILAPVASELPETTDYSQMQDLLNFALGPMYDGSPAIGRDPQSGLLIAYSVLPLAELTPVKYKEAFEAFVTFAMAMTERFEADGTIPVTNGDEDENALRV